MGSKVLASTTDRTTARATALVAIALLIAALLALTGCSAKPAATTTESSASQSAGTQETQPTQPTEAKGPTSPEVTELKVEDVKVGTGAEAVSGKTISVQYAGYLNDGTKFDASKDHGGQPFEFVLGSGNVIQGWDQGVAGMKVGGVRKLIIPPSLGYGAQGAGNVIPPNATLIFEVELVGVQ
jgi:FKBP-type peptidyl-prolyl cis-trans isomerase